MTGEHDIVDSLIGDAEAWREALSLDDPLKPLIEVTRGGVEATIGLLELAVNEIVQLRVERR